MLIAGSVAPVRGSLRANATEYEEELTAEEEREAVQVAEQFVKSFEEKNNPSSLIDELYVKDFDARLRREPNPFIYLAKIEPEVVEKASREELRRLYAASLNFIYSSSLLYGLALYNRKLRGVEADSDETPLRELLPPGVLLVLKDDPLMAALIAEDEELEREKMGEQKELPEQGGRAASEKEEGAGGPEIRSLERLRGFLYTLERASVLLREYLKTAQGPRNWKELANELRTQGVENESGDNCEGLCPRLHVLTEEFFGSPKGTRLVCVDVMAFHMDLIRIDGRLRILNVYLSSD
jgi:hypothetical protein